MKKKFNHEVGAKAAMFAATFLTALLTVVSGLLWLIVNDHLGIAVVLLVLGLSSVVYLAAGSEGGR